MIAQIFAVVIFLAMFILIITEVWERHIVTLGCAPYIDSCIWNLYAQPLSNY